MEWGLNRKGGFLLSYIYIFLYIIVVSSYSFSYNYFLVKYW